MLPKYVCTYYTYLYLYNPYPFKFLIYWNTVLILFHAYLNLAVLLAYDSHGIACTLVVTSLLFSGDIQTTHVSFPNTLQNFPFQCPLQSNCLTIY